MMASPLLSGEEEKSVAVDAALGHIGLGKLHLLLLLFAGATQFADAMELILISFLADELRCPWGLSQFEVTCLQLSVLVGMGVGAVVSGSISDRFGRWRGTAFAIATTGIFGLLSSFAPGLYTMLAARFLVGVGVGSAPTALGLYAECLPDAGRSNQLVIFFSFFSVGGVIEALVAWGSLGGAGEAGWRVLLLVSSMPSLLLLCLLPFVPESPRWLLEAGRDAEAKRVMRQIARVNGKEREVPWDWGEVTFTQAAREKDVDVDVDEDKDDVDDDVDDYEAEGRAQRGGEGSGGSSSRGTLKRLLRDPDRRFVTGVLSGMFFLMAGLYYAIVIASNMLAVGDAGGGDRIRCHGSRGPSYSTWEFVSIVVTNAAELPGLAAAAMLVGRIERRRAITVFFVACGIFMGLMLLPGEGSWVHRVMAFGARGSAQGFNVSLWILAAEYFPTSVRVLGVGVTTAFARLGSILSPFIVEYAFDDSAALGVGLCVAIAASGAALSLALPPDTSLAMHTCTTSTSPRLLAMTDNAAATEAANGPRNLKDYKAAEEYQLLTPPSADG